MLDSAGGRQVFIESFQRFPHERSRPTKAFVVSRRKRDASAEVETASSRPAPEGGLFGMPGHLVRRINQISTAIFSEECAEPGMTSVQFAALMAIQENPDVDATRLSSLIAFDRSTLGDVLERLEARGWIARNPSAHDKRVKLLRLKPAGHAALEDVEPKVRRVQRRLLEPLAHKDRIALMRILSQLVQLHEQTPMDAAP